MANKLPMFPPAWPQPITFTLEEILTDTHSNVFMTDPFAYWMRRKETVSIDRLKSAFVTQVGTGDNNKPLSEQAQPRSSVTIRSNPTTGAAATATAASFTPPEDNPVTNACTGRIQRRPVRFC
ncbi:hypothetical protein RRG08_035951 [Elysia crispata]|uniref:Uncharacterized protein n=1 Tax=Elysia crispata TaxID=231223 RepID=A0AAE1E3G7_9GAST|nr:hypothetical protein RRG08_035951 [Elysia crispata]